MVRKVRELNAAGHGVILDLLGESGNANGSKWERADKTKAIADIIVSEGLKASLAIRPGQFEEDYKLLVEVSNYITKSGTFAWLDIERRNTRILTISAYQEAVGANPGKVGLALQAYYKKSLWDVENLIKFADDSKVELHIRPVRGVYVEEADEGFKTLAEMHKNLARMMHMMAMCHSGYVTQHPASHHPEQMARAALLHSFFGDKVIGSLQLLMGVYSKFPAHVLETTCLPVEIYVPFGPSTAAYLQRRIREAKDTVGGLIRARLAERKNIRTFDMLVSGKSDIDLVKPELPFIKAPADAEMDALYAGR